MEKSEIFKTLNKYKETLEEKGYKVLYIGLYGSQNYNVDDELSDIDAKAIILPTLEDIIFRKVTSKVIECENGSIDVKDLITFYDVIKKGNFSYIEAMDTEYSIGDKEIKEMFKIYRPNLKSILGAMYEKQKALTHEYPSKHEEFEKWGFDPKQLHHIIRLAALLETNIALHISKSYLTYNFVRNVSTEYRPLHLLPQSEMIDIKRNKTNMSKEEAIRYADDVMQYAKSIMPSNYSYEVINIDSKINYYIESRIKLELLKHNPVVSAREVRTFDNEISKKDLEKFPILQEYKGKDISYIVYESIDIL